jgi:hypothetical protein
MTTIKEDVDAVFRQLASGDFRAPTDLEKSGWEMQLPSGRVVARSMLQAEARPLIAHGRDAVLHLLPWVMDTNLALRYVARYALEEITGEKSDVSYFAEDAPAKAIETWRKWCEGSS